MTSSPGSIYHGYGRNCRELERWLAAASDTGLRRRSAGTRWTNEELLFHMVFGYMVVRALLPLVRIFGALPVLPGPLGPLLQTADVDGGRLCLPHPAL